MAPALLAEQDDNNAGKLTLIRQNRVLAFRSYAKKRFLSDLRATSDRFTNICCLFLS